MRRLARPPLSPVAVLAALLALLLGTASATAAPQDEEAGFRVLVFSKVTNFYHDSIPAGIAAVEKLGEEYGFEVDSTDDAGAFTEENLANYEAVLFNNTNSTPESGDLLDAGQRAALQSYIQAGGGWLGLHAASASERDWDWYEGLVGAIFDKHPVPQTGRIKVLDNAHPSTKGLPQLWERNEEWYNWRANPTGKVHTLAQVKVRDGITGLDEGVDQAYSWCQKYDGGRSWFTAGGHDASSFDEPLFLKHLLGGIRWAAGDAPGDCSATQTGNFQRTALVSDDLADPFELAVAPDRRVFYAQRTGELKVVDQETLNVTTALDFDYTPEMTSQSDGLLGLALDPGFAKNNWVYLLHSDKEKNLINLSRFTMKGDTADPASQKVLLTIPTWRGEGRANVHMAGSVTFDAQGNLYVATGDNTDPFESSGFTPIDERDGRRAWDAQGTAGNTNDLRGKVLRVKPTNGGGYTIPKGNLFKPGEAKTRPEIYAMGFRNPFRITTDPLSGALLVADYGPDARSADPNRGPEGTVEYNRITKASNQGWPYCIGNNTPFNDYDFAAAEAGEKFDCSAPVNDSPNNTGKTELPPAQPATVWYAYSASQEFPELGTGGGGPMSGPVYDYDPKNDSPYKFPEYFEGKWITYELTRKWFKTFSFQEKDQQFEDPRFEPAKKGDLQSINGIFGDMDWVQPFEAHFGPDGSLYVIDFGEGSGTGRGGSNENAGIYRIDYVAEGRPPVAKLSASADSGPAPLTVEFSSEGSHSPGDDPITYAWDFDGDGTTDSTDPNPTHTYTEKGRFNARLTVEGPPERTGMAVHEVTVGNTRPEVKVTMPANGTAFDFGDTVPYKVEVSDAEDGDIDCSRVVVQTQLGHDDHLHPLDNLTGCEGEFKTDPGDSHGPGQNLYYGISAQYEDAGAEGVPSLVGSDSLSLRQKFREAEHHNGTGGANGGVQTLAREDSSGGKRLGEIENGDWIVLDPGTPSGIDSVTVGASSGGLGGDIEFRANAPDGELLGKATIPNTGDFANVVSPTVPLADPGGVEKVYVVFSNPAWTPTSPDLVALDWLHFNGRGAEKESAAKVTVAASPESGTAPAEVSFEGAVTLPEGRTAKSYHWAFGDNATADGAATATHTYTRKGTYTAHLTVTDDTGDLTSGAVQVTVN